MRKSLDGIDKTKADVIWPKSASSSSSSSSWLLQVLLPGPRLAGTLRAPAGQATNSSQAQLDTSQSAGRAANSSSATEQVQVDQPGSLGDMLDSVGWPVCCQLCGFNRRLFCVCVCVCVGGSFVIFINALSSVKRRPSTVNRWPETEPRVSHHSD